MRITIVPTLLLLIACKAPSSPPADAPSAEKEDGPSVDAETDENSGLTAAACEAAGGQVVGDIGDGAIHRSDYRCPDSGEAPLGTIVADPSGPVAVEGAVCCR